MQNCHIYKMIPKAKRPRRVHPINDDTYYWHNTFMAMAKGVENEEEIEMNAIRNVPIGDQTGQLLAMMRIM